MKKHFLSENDIYYFSEGQYRDLHHKLGAHTHPEGVHFAVWAPNARHVGVIGDFNGWNRDSHPLHPVGSSGIWAGLVRGAHMGQCYKYAITARHGNHYAEKADPVALCTETPPRTGSVIWDLDYEWRDQDWMAARGKRQALDSPQSIYEIHFGSWRRKAEDNNRPLSYREMADELIPYLLATGFTHVEFMPIMEHPFGGSWGYQVTGYFAPSRRYGDPQDFMYLVDRLHQAGIGVILDWVPSHFPTDVHGLHYFDGTHLYEHEDPRQGFHPDWESSVFNYGRNEVRSFLISNALFWIEKYHIDALRVDAVASMLYLDYSREAGTWVPNEHGGRENLAALQFLRMLNEAVYHRHPDVQMIAEESTSWPMVSRPTYLGGVGFGMKWDMGWMNDTLNYFRKDPLFRAHHQNDITFRSLYSFHENFVLSLSHDEVVHEKGSMIAKMPGDEWQKFANLRCLYGYMFTQPGKKLLFMGNEFAQWAEWDHDRSLDWHLLQKERHSQTLKLVTDLNKLYREEAALHLDCDPAGFEWIDANDNDHAVISYLRKGRDSDLIACVLNFTPVPRHNYHIGVPKAGYWTEIFNSDAHDYGGSGCGNLGGAHTIDTPCHGRPCHLALTLPPLSAVMLKWTS